MNSNNFKLKSVGQTVCFILLYTLVSSFAVFAHNYNDDTHLKALQQRLKNEEKLYNISNSLYKRIEQEINKILDDIYDENKHKLKTKNYLLEQLRLQATKIALQSQRILIAKDTVEQELIAEENALYQLENKLLTLAGAGRTIMSNSDISLNKDIKKLQSAISYHKSIIEINSKRLKVLSNHYLVISQLQGIQNKKVVELQQLLDEESKQKNLIRLSKREIKINQEIQSLLETEMQSRKQVEELDLATLESTASLPEYNNLRVAIIETVNKRGLLELELSVLRLNTRLADIAYLFESENQEALKHKKYLSERVERLSKEAITIKNLSHNNLSYVSDFISFIDKEKQVKNMSLNSYNKSYEILTKYEHEFKQYLKNVSKTVNQISSYRDKLKELYLKDVSVRQTLPESFAEWQLLVHDITSIPYLLSKQVLVSWLQLQSYLSNDTGIKIIKLIVLQALLIALMLTLYNFICSFKHDYQEEYFEKFSSAAFYVIAKLLYNNKIVLVSLFNFIITIWYTEATGIFISVLLHLSLLFLSLRFLVGIFYIFLIENSLEISGDDSRLYKGLKYALIFGGILYAFMIVGQALNLTLNTLGFIDRLFMLFLLAISYPLIMNWQVVPHLIIDNLKPKVYVRRVIWLLGIIVPVTILSNAALGIIGYVNLAWKIAIAEVQLSLVIALWLILKGFLGELMDVVSRFFIRNVTNGWLWTESVLKPLHTLLNFTLFLMSVLGLVFIYGWNSNIELLHVLNNTFNYSFDINVGNTENAQVRISVKDLFIFCVIFAVVIWATKWSREFSYRWLYSKTKDLAVRNSFSVFTQYTTLVVGIILILRVLGIPTSTLMVTVGGLLFFLGFGLRDIISNYISGLILLIERPVRAGDFVTIGSFEGKITKIGMRSLTVQSFDNMEVIVPNTDTITKPLINWTFKDTVIRMDLEFRIDYEEDIQYVRDLILQAIISNEDVLEEPNPKVYFKEFQETALIAKIYYFIDLNKTPSRGASRTAVILAINKALAEHKVKVAYPRQTVAIDRKANYSMTKAEEKPEVNFDSETSR